MESTKEINWRDYFKLPLKQKFEGIPMFWIDDAEGHHALDIMCLKEEEQKHFLDIINGKKENDDTHTYTLSEKYPTDIVCDGKFVIIRLRGWGHLTGRGALNLDGETAAAIQDGFMQYVLDRLNSKKKGGGA